MSRAIEILTAIQNGQPYNAEAVSTSEAILKSIANGTEYTDEPMSRFEELLLAVKNGETVSETPQSRIEEILSAIANGTLDEWLLEKNLLAPITTENLTFVEDHMECRLPTQKGKQYTLSISNLSSVGGKENTVISLWVNDVHYRALVNTKEGVVNNFAAFTGTGNDFIYGYTPSQTQANWKEEVYASLLTKYLVEPKLEIGTTATPYTPYAFSELEEALIATSNKLKGA